MSEAVAVAREQIAWWQQKGVTAAEAWAALHGGRVWFVEWWEVQVFMVRWWLNNPPPA